MNQKRKCRDVLCIPIFIAYWVAMLFILYVSLQHGDPARLVFATDYLGNICGANPAQMVVEDQENGTGLCYGGEACGKFITYPKLDEDLYGAQLGGFLANPLDLLEYPFHGVCRHSCPEGLDDVDQDGELDNWVCNYAVMDEVNMRYGVNDVSPEIPSAGARLALEECLEEKVNAPFLIGLAALPENMLLSNGVRANCRELMTGCWKMYSTEKPLFFRCIALTDQNTTCSRSPYLEYMNESVSRIQHEDGSNSTRPSSDPHCGVCLEPSQNIDGSPMDPGSEQCKAKKVFSNVITTVSQVNPVLSSVNTWTQNLQAWLGDVSNTIPQIAISGAVIPFFLGIVWLVFLRVAAKTFVFTVLYGLLFFLIFLSLQFLIYGEVITADNLLTILDKLNNATGLNISSEEVSSSIVSVNLFENEAEDQTELYEVLGWVLTGCTAFYFLLLLSLYRRIKIAVAIIKEATIAISAMPIILLFPTFTVLGTILIGAYWAFVCLYLVSMNDLRPVNITDVSIVINENSTEAQAAVEALQSYLRSEAEVYAVDNHRVLQDLSEDATALLDNFTATALNSLGTLPYLEIFFVYHLMGFFWTNQLIQAIGATTIAGAVGSWYWSTAENNKKSKSMPRRPVLKSLYRVFRYHLGSLIFGSFIIALVQVIRTILMYIDKYTQGLQKKNTVVRVMMKSLQCCLCILEKVLKFISRNAYIFIALFGKSFCSSTKEVFGLLVKNILQIGVATAVSNMIIFLGRILIVSVSCFVCSTILSLPEDSALSAMFASLSLNGKAEAPSSIVPSVLMTALLAWFVSGCFMHVYGLTIDTILISFCVDEEKNDGTPERPYYMTKSLKKLTKKWNKKAKKVHVETTHSKNSSGSSKPNKE